MVAEEKTVIKKKIKCNFCHHTMKIEQKCRGVDKCEWVCRRRAKHKGIVRKFIRHQTIFSKSKMCLFSWMRFLYRFAQGLRLRQVDMITDNIATSSATLTRMAKLLRNVCVEAVERMRRKRGQWLEGRREFVEIDESHFRHKRKYGRGRITGGWKRKKWVFGMLGVKHSRRRPILRLVPKRTRQELVPLIVHHIRRGTSVLSDEWRAYRQVLPALGYDHYTVNHSQASVNADTGCHTQHIERAWWSYKEIISRCRGNRTEDLLTDHLTLIEWNEWLAKKHRNGPLGRLLHDSAKKYK
ncbi:uncharacterized protein LOC143123460 [Alosa pseudoharengus]|uniref:uncharacterized protein LOC143123460 n=1 Tax=Alosa pseudoharengus TaxID=34774 RepID=UPI003F8A8273